MALQQELFAHASARGLKRGLPVPRGMNHSPSLLLPRPLAEERTSWDFLVLNPEDFMPGDSSGEEAKPIDEEFGAGLGPDLALHQTEPTRLHDRLGHESGSTSPAGMEVCDSKVAYPGAHTYMCVHARGYIVY